MHVDNKRKCLKISRRGTFSYEVIFKQNGAYYDITGWTIYFTVKTKMEDSDANAKIKKKITTHSDPVNGKSLISLTATDTNITAGRYWYSIDYKDGDGNQGILFTGNLEVEEPVLNIRD